MNNTAEGTVHVVLPAIIDIEIIDITDFVSKPDSPYLSIDLANSGERSLQAQMNITDWDNNWNLVEQHYYFMKIVLFDRDKHEIELTNNLKFGVDLNKEYFEVKQINRIGSEMIVRAIKPTPDELIMKVNGRLEEISSKKNYRFPIDKDKITA